MEKLYAVVGQDHKAILIKVTDAISLVPVFRERSNAEEYIVNDINENFRRDVTVLEFSLAIFDASRSWADKSGTDLFVHVYD